jgi:hypothetical protein
LVAPQSPGLLTAMMGAYSEGTQQYQGATAHTASPGTGLAYGHGAGALFRFRENRRTVQKTPGTGKGHEPGDRSWGDTTEEEGSP